MRSALQPTHTEMENETPGAVGCPTQPIFRQKSGGRLVARLIPSWHKRAGDQRCNRHIQNWKENETTGAVGWPSQAIYRHQSICGRLPDSAHLRTKARVRSCMKDGLGQIITTAASCLGAEKSRKAILGRPTFYICILNHIKFYYVSNCKRLSGCRCKINESH